MFSITKKLILASSSPRRKNYLENLGIPHTVHAPDVDEQVAEGERPDHYVERIAASKCQSVMAQYPEWYIIAADTTVVVGKEILNKPQDSEHAVEMLMRLVSRDHKVYTGLCVGSLADNQWLSTVVETTVSFGSFSKNVIQSYVATGEPLDKAGGYGIQDKGAFLVTKINGSYSNVVGLPMSELLSMLRDCSALDGS